MKVGSHRSNLIIVNSGVLQPADIFSYPLITYFSDLFTVPLAQILACADDVVPYLSVFIYSDFLAFSCISFESFLQNLVASLMSLNVLSELPTVFVPLRATITWFPSLSAFFWPKMSIT